MNGKRKCETLKAVRKRVAEANHIDLKIHDCHFTGDCPGTCPACESELQTLTAALAARQRSGKRIAVTALAAGLVTVSAGCSAPFLPDPPPEPVDIVPYQSTSETDSGAVMGKIGPKAPQTEENGLPEHTLMGDIAAVTPASQPETAFTLTGLVPNPSFTDRDVPDRDVPDTPDSPGAPDISNASDAGHGAG